MAYEKQTWVDEILAEAVAAYTLARGDGSVLADDIRIILKTAILQAGSRVIAERMNHMEDGIAAAHDLAAGLKILGFYDTLGDLQAAVTNPAAGDVYGIGTSEPYDLYIWNGAAGAWINAGQLHGVAGSDGLSAYQIWLAAGNEGSVQDYLDSLIGAPGAAAFTLEIGEVTTGAPESQAIVENVGTEAHQIWNITVPEGRQGTAAFTIAIGTITTGAPGSSATVTNVGTAQNQIWNIMIPRGKNGRDGDDGSDGDDGLSAYQIWLAAGNTGSEADFLESLKGGLVPHGNSHKVGGTDPLLLQASQISGLPVVPAFENSAAAIQPAGEASAGASGNMARADHVHPGSPGGFNKSTGTLAVADWDAQTRQQTISMAGVTTDNDIISGPDVSVTNAYPEWVNRGVKAIAQGAGTVTYECESIPTLPIGVQVYY